MANGQAGHMPIFKAPKPKPLPQQFSAHDPEHVAGFPQLHMSPPPPLLQFLGSQSIEPPASRYLVLFSVRPAQHAGPSLEQSVSLAFILFWSILTWQIVLPGFADADFAHDTPSLAHVLELATLVQMQGVLEEQLFGEDVSVFNAP